MLCAPVVDSPITPCTRKVRVSSVRAGTTVRIFQDGLVVGEGTAARSTAFIPLHPQVTLTTGRRITATQTVSGETSLPTPAVAAATVLATPTPAMLAQLISRSRLLECGECIWLEGVVPGATVSVQFGSGPPTTVVADWTAVHFDVPPLAASVPVLATQVACGVTGAQVSLPPALPQAHGRVIESPSVETPLKLCQRAVTLRVLPGARVTLEHDGSVTTFCFGSTTGTFWLARGLELRDRVTLRQEFHNCQLESGAAEYGPTQFVPDPPEFPYPVCAGDVQVELAGVDTGAQIQFFRDDESAPFASTDAGESHRFNLPPLEGAKRLGVRQALCDFGPWSETTFTDVVPEGPADRPVLIEPVYACGAAVAVTGLSRGTHVRIASKMWGGAIGEAVGDGDEFVDVNKLDFPLIEGDQLNLETIQCGVFRGHGYLTPVQPAPERLDRPELDNPLDDAGGRIRVRNVVPGALLDLQLLDRRVDPPVLLFLASEPVTHRKAHVRVPPLQAGWFVRVHQRLCGRASEPSRVTLVGDRYPRYLAHSTFRICQLTGAEDIAGRPHPFNTTQVDLFGTDLGVPVEHRKRLYLFFGDSKKGVRSAPDGDPIAWTTSSPEPDGPVLHWLVNPDGDFRRLTVEGVPTLENFEVPTGGFGHAGKLYLFIAREKVGGKMQTSHLAVSKGPNHDPNENLRELYKVASTLDDGANAPAGAWLVHVSPTVIRNADWPGLPQGSGDGLFLFGTKVYQSSDVFLAWAPLPAGQDPSHPSTWRYFKAGHPGGWIAAPLIPAGQDPTPLIGERVVGELSVIWYPPLRRWVMAHTSPTPNSLQVVIRTARMPWGPWSAAVTIFDGVNARFQADAGNLQPSGKFVGFPHADENVGGNTVAYAPYLVRRWTRLDASTRTVTLYYTLSVSDPPYHPQLMRTRLQFG